MAAVESTRSRWRRPHPQLPIFGLMAGDHGTAGIDLDRVADRSGGRPDPRAVDREVLRFLNLTALPAGPRGIERTRRPKLSPSSIPSLERSLD